VTVFFLCGLWHGASWNFVIWGLFHGTFLVVERVGAADAIKKLWPPLRHVYLLIVVMIGWVFFRADTLSAALSYLKSMAGLRVAAPTPYLVSWYLTPELCLALVAGAIGSTPIVPALSRRRDAFGETARPRLGWALDVAGTAVLFVVLLASIMQVAARTYNPFIYFRF
jgi:alginate O-acetyltransferase complex protein AlgI